MTIPLGLYGAARPVAAGGTGARTFVGAYSNETDQSVYTFSVPVGAGSKTIIVAGTGRLNAAHSLTSVTVDGDALTLDAANNYIGQGQGFVGHITAVMPATVDVVLTFSTAMLRCGIGVWTVDGSVTVTDSYTAESPTSGAHTLSLIAADHVIGYTTNSGDSGSTWSGATERFDGPAGTGAFWHHSGADGVAADPAVTAARAAATNSIIVGASYDNA